MWQCKRGGSTGYMAMVLGWLFNSKSVKDDDNDE